MIPLEVQRVSGIDWYEESVLEQDVWRLSLVTYGTCVYWVKGEKQIIEKGEVLLIPAGVPYYGKNIPTITHTQMMVLWTEDKTMGLSVLERGEALRLKPGSYELIHERMKAIFQQWKERPAYYATMIGALLIEVLIYLSREFDRGVIPPETHRHVERMKRYIERHYQEKVTKVELGEEIAKSPNYAALLFKHVTGQTISQYLHAQRMKRATYLLTESQLTVQEIAEYLGYQDLSYFYRIYKREIGSVPSDLLQERPRMI
ncbi:hypothetical protein JCM10914A_29920 [Paenibacillus sp. JCM 10914]|nr:hypothetical protein JCM10914_3336 [Paenibacillus sp. JCM 10914]